jgi:hypothetical protein
MNDDEIRRQAKLRHQLHANHPTHRPLSPDYEFVGLSGERQLATELGVPMDLRLRPDGDGGVDFTLPLITRDGVQEFIIDVKCAQKPGNLIVEVGKVKPRTIYILAGFHEDRLLGWELGAKLLRAPIRDFGYGIINHYIARDELRKMRELMACLPLWL